MAKWIVFGDCKYNLTRIDGSLVVRKFGRPRELISLSEEEVIERILREGRTHTKSKIPIDHQEFSF